MSGQGNSTARSGEVEVRTAFPNLNGIGGMQPGDAAKFPTENSNDHTEALVQ